jgi:hypothetical protein
MRAVVEDAGGEWFASRLGRWCRLVEADRGEYDLGGRRVWWTLDRDGEVAVSHTRPSGEPGETDAYTVRLTFTPLRSGGRRWWWVCPACERRVDVLYLPQGRDRLGCRRCCRLVYRSQYAAGRVARRKGRPPLGLEESVRRWEFNSATDRLVLVYDRRRRY